MEVGSTTSESLHSLDVRAGKGGGLLLSGAVLVSSLVMWVLATYVGPQASLVALSGLVFGAFWVGYKTLRQQEPAPAGSAQDPTEARAKDLTAQAYRRLLHDLHNPVAALRQLSKALQGELSQDPEAAMRVALMLPDVADQILAQIETTRIALSLKAPTLVDEDVCPTVKAAFDTVVKKMNSTGQVEVNFILPTEPLVVSHDPELLQSAISYLLCNAFEASRKRIQVTLSKSGQGARIRFDDDGPGMSLEEVGLFLQGRGRSTKPNRLGIGLATANHIARTHGGRIVYHSSVLGGASFEFRMEEKGVL